MSHERFRVHCEAFDSASEWQALLPQEIAAGGDPRPIHVLLEELKAKGVECRLIKTSRSGTVESYLLDRKTPTGNSQAAISLEPLP